MLPGTSAAIFSLLLVFFHGCTGPSQAVQLKHQAAGNKPEMLAVYEGWFGLPKHIDVGYSSHDPELMKSQIRHAKEMNISAFVVDWYGDREPYIDRTYALMQAAAAKNKFKVAMMYDEANVEDGATDLVIADLTMFHDTYLINSAPGHQAYLTYEGRPVIFVFPYGGHTDWAKVREVVNRWPTPPLLIQENLPGPHPEAFDGFYPWVNPGPKGWAADGSNNGDSYLRDFYVNMGNKYSSSIVVGGVWPGLDDTKASWSLNRHIAANCGKTWALTNDLWRTSFPPDQTIPFVLIETWNDYEEGTAIEKGIPSCNIDSASPLPQK